ncbi:MAG: AAA family ATPase [Pseudobacteriovorax sp.]|nr:AAA family ATPase [Pseudobacteriovorax sp.]
MNFLNNILKRKVILITGKGGIGKTTVAAGLAQYAAAQGKKVCLVESSSRDQLSPLFGVDAVGHNLSELQKNIFAINLKPAENFRDFVTIHLGFAKLFERVFTKAIVQSFIKMLPGVAELTLLGRLFYFSELEKDQSFDLIIFDGFASGHFLSLLKTPDAVLNSGMVGPIIKETQRVRDFLLDPQRVATVIVTMAEKIVMKEAVDFAVRLEKEVGAGPQAVIVNRCLPSTLDQPSSEIIEDNSLDQNQAWQYLKLRQDMEYAAVKSLSKALSDSQYHSETAVTLMPDIGWVTEPLADNFAETWFAAAKEAH